MLKPCYKDMVGQQQEKQKTAHDGKRAEQDQRFQVEQWVLTRDYRQGNLTGVKGRSMVFSVHDRT